MLGVRGVEGRLALLMDLFGGAVVHRSFGVHPDPGVAMFMVAGGEETVAECANVGQ